MRRGPRLSPRLCGRQTKWGLRGAVHAEARRGMGVFTTDARIGTDSHGTGRKPPFQPRPSVKSVKSVVKTGAAIGGVSRGGWASSAQRAQRTQRGNGGGAEGDGFYHDDSDGSKGQERFFGRRCRCCRCCEGQVSRWAVLRGEGCSPAGAQRAEVLGRGVGLERKWFTRRRGCIGAVLGGKLAGRFAWPSW